MSVATKISSPRVHLFDPTLIGGSISAEELAITKTRNSTSYWHNATRSSKAHLTTLFAAALTTSISIAAPACAGEIHAYCHDSIAESQRDHVFISLVDVEPKQFSALGNNFSIREAWLEKFGAKTKPTFYWLCFSLYENGSPHVDKVPHTPDVTFKDTVQKRLVEGHKGSPRSAKLKRHLLKRNRKYPVIYSIECRLDDTEPTVEIFTTKPVSMTSNEVIRTPIGTSLHFKIPPNHSHH